MKYYAFKYSSVASEKFESFGYGFTNFIAPFVVIKTSKGEQYCFAIDHQEEFVEEVLRRKPELRDNEKEKI